MQRNTSKDRADVYQRITEQIIEAIEKGADQWTMPWHTSSAIPGNAATGKPYRGVNVLTLWTTAAAKGYRSGLWATYAQWQELGAQGRKAEKSTLIVFWKFRDQSERSDEDENENSQTSKRGPLARGYNVFNADQVDGFEPPSMPALPQAERIDSADAFFTNLRADVRHGGSRAFYRPAEDFIQMPPFKIFQEPTSYYATLGHEYLHWSGAPNRLNRDLKGRFGSEAYAAEELIAELGRRFPVRRSWTGQRAPARSCRLPPKLVANTQERPPGHLHRRIYNAQAAADWLHSFQPEAASTVVGEEVTTPKTTEAYA